MIAVSKTIITRFKDNSSFLNQDMKIALKHNLSMVILSFTVYYNFKDSHDIVEFEFGSFFGLFSVIQFHFNYFNNDGAATGYHCLV